MLMSREERIWHRTHVSHRLCQQQRRESRTRQHIPARTDGNEWWLLWQSLLRTLDRLTWARCYRSRNHAHFTSISDWLQLINLRANRHRLSIPITLQYFLCLGIALGLFVRIPYISELTNISNEAANAVDSGTKRRPAGWLEERECLSQIIYFQNASRGNCWTFCKVVVSPRDLLDMVVRVVQQPVFFPSVPKLFILTGLTKPYALQERLNYSPHYSFVSR